MFKRILAQQKPPLIDNKERDNQSINSIISFLIVILLALFAFKRSHKIQIGRAHAVFNILLEINNIVYIYIHHAASRIESSNNRRET